MTAAPHQAGTRSRASNAMGRAREGVLDGALRSVIARGTRGTTMSGIATMGGVAKATVYNHFRTKAEVFDALLEREIARAEEACASQPDVRAALECAAAYVAEHPARVSLATREPEVLAALVGAAPRHEQVLSRAAAVLARPGHEPTTSQVELVCRVLSTFLLAPSTAEQRRGVIAELTEVLAARGAVLVASSDGQLVNLSTEAS